jgi:TRAP-type C4-dicarboxylate transport system permease small subunit
MNLFWNFLDRVEHDMKMLGAACLIGMVIITCLDVIGRLMSYPIFGSEEMVAFLMTIVVGLSLPFAHKEKIHVGVEIVVRLLPEKTQKFIRLCTDTVSLALMITITVMMFVFAMNMMESGEVSMNLEWPEYYVIFTLSICFFVLNFFILKDIISYFKKDKGST